MRRLRNAGAALFIALFLALALFVTGAFAQSAQVSKASRGAMVHTSVVVHARTVRPFGGFQGNSFRGFGGRRFGGFRRNGFGRFGGFRGNGFGGFGGGFGGFRGNGFGGFGGGFGDCCECWDPCGFGFGW